MTISITTPNTDFCHAECHILCIAMLDVVTVSVVTLIVLAPEKSIFLFQLVLDDSAEKESL
jgi:hypothetical protein